MEEHAKQDMIPLDEREMVSAKAGWWRTEEAQIQLWALLQTQTKRYTMGDSTSVPIEIAQELMTSIEFCIRLGGKEEHPLTADLQQLFRQGKAAVSRQVARGKGLLEAAKHTAPGIENGYYQDTLEELGLFFRQYDPEYFAHQIPCMISYQLLLPVEGEGIVFINAYLRRLIMENRLCSWFDKERVQRLLRAHCGDYRYLLVNFFAPVYANAVGLLLVGEDIRRLDITDEMRKRMLTRISGYSRRELGAALAHLSRKLARTMAMEEMEAYLVQASEELYSRLYAAVRAGSLDHVFLSLATEALPKSK